jgi:quercetin dioxygenase-like cupin family protein
LVSVWFGQVGRLPPLSFGVVEVDSWNGEHHLAGGGTAFVVAFQSTTITVEHGDYPLVAASYAVLPLPAALEGGSGLIVTDRSHRGLFMVGGPVESCGRLRYIDGCSDTVLVSPLVRGDPCLNMLHLPAGIVQTDHDHPSLRVGVILTGTGQCVIGDGHAEPLTPGVVFVLEAGATHRFETTSQPLTLIAWHPDSDFGPTDDDHPMLNRTLQPGTSRRIR